MIILNIVQITALPGCFCWLPAAITKSVAGQQQLEKDFQAKNGAKCQGENVSLRVRQACNGFRSQVGKVKKLAEIFRKLQPLLGTVARYTDQLTRGDKIYMQCLTLRLIFLS